MLMMRVELFLIQGKEVTDELLKQLVASYSGYTAMYADGAWLNDELMEVQDDVLVVTMFIPDTPKNRMDVDELMSQYLIDAKQDCVLYVINGNDATFIKD